MKILLVLIDGMRPDALADIPQVKRMMTEATYSLDVRTVMPSVTLPCHMSLFHSVDSDRHGITTNTYTPQVRPIAGLCEQLKAAGKQCAFFYNWHPETERVEAEALRIASEKTRETDDQNRDVRFNAAIKAAEEATVRANEAANKNGVDGKDGVSPTVKVESISGGHKVTITDKDGDKSFNVMDGATVNDVIAALPKYNGEVVDV